MKPNEKLEALIKSGDERYRPSVLGRKIEEAKLAKDGTQSLNKWRTGRGFNSDTLKCQTNRAGMARVMELREDYFEPEQRTARDRWPWPIQDPVKVGERLKHQRVDARDMRRADLAEQAGVSLETVDAWEAGLLQITPDYAAKIAEILQTSARYLMSGVQEATGGGTMALPAVLGDFVRSAEGKRVPKEKMSALTAGFRDAAGTISLEEIRWILGKMGYVDPEVALAAAEGGAGKSAMRPSSTARAASKRRRA